MIIIYTIIVVYLSWFWVKIKYLAFSKSQIQKVYFVYSSRAWYQYPSDVSQQRAISQNEEWNIKGNRYIQKVPRFRKDLLWRASKVWLGKGLGERIKKKWSYAQSKLYSFLNQNKIMIFPGVLVSVIIAVIKHNNKQQIGNERVYLF